MPLPGWTATSSLTGHTARPRRPRRARRRARTQRRVHRELTASLDNTADRAHVGTAGVHECILQARREAGAQECREGPDSPPCSRRRPHLQRHRGTGRQGGRGRGAASHCRSHGPERREFDFAASMRSLPASAHYGLLCSVGRQDHLDPLPRPPVHQEHYGRHQGPRHRRLGCAASRQSAHSARADPVPPRLAGKNRRLTFIEVPNDLGAMIDTAKVADLVLLMIDGSFGLEMVRSPRPAPLFLR